MEIPAGVSLRAAGFAKILLKYFIAQPMND